MKSKFFMCGFLLLFITILAACTSNSSLGHSEKQQMVEHVKTVEESEVDLIYFNKSYEEYYKDINEIVSEDYWASISGDIIFGYDNATFTRNDLANMQQEEYDNHKERMLNVIRGIGFDKLNAKISISEVYEGNQSDQVNIYTLENKNLKDEPFTVTTKRYSLEKHSEKWFVTKVELDKFTYGSELTAEEIEEGIKGLNYQTHDGKVIEYSSVISWSGEGL